MGLTCRKAEKKDMPAVLGFIRELAEFHKAPAEVTLTVDQLERDGFGERPVFEALLAEEDGEALGMAFYYFSYSTWKGLCVHLEDIVIREKCRGRGIGKALMAGVARRALEMSAKRIQWQVFTWNTRAIEFYRRLGAAVGDDWVNCRLSEKQISEMAAGR